MPAHTDTRPLASRVRPGDDVQLSPDGYVRLTARTLETLPLVHLVSGLDDDFAPDPRPDGSIATLTGYTEWVSTCIPVISIGWDWRLAHLEPTYARVGAPRSNVMLTDDAARDLGETATSALLAIAVDRLTWQPTVYAHVAARYA